MKYLLCVSVIGMFWCNQVLAQWSNCPPTGFRNWNSIGIIDKQTALLVGGNKSNDSIRDVIKTTNGAVSWDPVFDQINPWFRSVAFPNASTGIVVGNNGTIMRTQDLGSSFTAIAAPGVSATRDFNSVYFADYNIGYIVGGRQKNDSMQTILKTIDGGDHWSIQRDVQGGCLNSVFFTDPSNGFAVGDYGAMLQTTDGGSNWNVVALSGNIANRHYNSVRFLNGVTGFAAGGYPAHDSIQTILKTTDGGTNWTIVIDRLGPMLNALDFANSTTAYAVGNFGVAFNSVDTGNTWSAANLPSGGILDTMDLYAVKFLNADYGLVSGRFGKVVKYINPVPVAPGVATLQASKVGNTSAQLNLSVNPKGFSTNVSFEYGTSPSMDNVVQVTGILSGTSLALDSIPLTGLIPNSFYYCRAVAVNQNGVDYGATIQFYTTDCEIPNCDFEIWDTIYIAKPVGWNSTGRVTKAVSYNGTNAVQLGPYGGALVLANISQNFPTGGFPFTARPDSVVMMVRYNVVIGDTALVILFFKKNGVIFTQDLIPITGNAGGNWVRLALAIQYSDTLTPDSLMMGVTSSNVFHQMGNPLSVVTVDDIHFTGTNILPPNWNFELWDSTLDTRVHGWYSDSYATGETTQDVTKVTNCVTGHYALQLKNATSGTRRVSIGDTATWNTPAFPVAGKHLILNMYLKYLKQDNDTLSISLAMFKNDSSIGYVSVIIDTPVLDYTPMSFDIHYNFSNAIPDSANLSIGVGSELSHSNSAVFIDDVSFDGFRVPSGIKTLVKSENGFALYPNPGSAYVTIDIPQFNKGDLQLLDLTGAQVYAEHLSAGKKDIDISQLPPGIYLVKINTPQNVMMKKLVIAR